MSQQPHRLRIDVWLKRLGISLNSCPQVLFRHIWYKFKALEIFQDVRQQETINIGFQQGGICSKFGIKKDDYLKRWECLFCSLKENTFTAVTAVGSSVESISQLKAV